MVDQGVGKRGEALKRQSLMFEVMFENYTHSKSQLMAWPRKFCGGPLNVNVEHKTMWMPCCDAIKSDRESTIIAKRMDLQEGG